MRPKKFSIIVRCRARRVSENAFRLLSQCFRIFYSPTAVLPDTTDSIVTVTCCLHNLLRDEYIQNSSENHRNSEAELPTGNMMPLGRPAGGFGNIEGFDVRTKFRQYFNAPEGSVAWQQNCLETSDSRLSGTLFRDEIFCAYMPLLLLLSSQSTKSCSVRCSRRHSSRHKSKTLLRKN